MKTQTLQISLLAAILVRCAVSQAPGAQTVQCNPPPSNTFTVFLPKVGLPPDEEGQGWVRPLVWEHLPDATDDSITVPNGRPIYALIVSGFGSNKYLDELMTYNFARHLMARGAYVHYAWWNNLLAPYMERPLHHSQSDPGGLDLDTITNFVTAELASKKAAPGEDYQFVADALLFLSAIRQNNPSAIIIVVGHSMGGGSVVHLGAKADVVLDILAPFDPTNNRNYPWMPPATEIVLRTYNWTRWRATRDTFLGFREMDGLNCVPAGPWLKDYTEAQANSSLLCKTLIYYNDAPTLGFGPLVINLHHGWQNEAKFPFDFNQNYTFGHSPPPGGSSSQAPIPTTPEFCGFLQPCADPGGWPNTTDLSSPCCQAGDGVGWPKDGHGEIVGYRGPVNLLTKKRPVPLGVRVRTSPQCGNCPNKIWPARSEFSAGNWLNGDGAARVALLQALETLPEATPWPHRPVNPNLCLVSPGLINLFNVMNKPPVANAGGDQTVECQGSHSAQVTLDGSKSTDPDGDRLDYRWTWDSGAASGAVVTAHLPTGSHCATLTVRDPSGHIDRRAVTVTVADTTPPDLSVQLSPRVLWPANHKMVNIRATVHASDSCGSVAELKLLSIVSNQADNGIGDGNTKHDISAKIGTLDQNFQLRAERSGAGGDRIYTVTYQATDDARNQTRVSQDVVVPHDAKSYQNWLRILKK